MNEGKWWVLIGSANAETIRFCLIHEWSHEPSQEEMDAAISEYDVFGTKLVDFFLFEEVGRGKQQVKIKKPPPPELKDDPKPDLLAPMKTYDRFWYQKQFYKGIFHGV